MKCFLSLLIIAKVKALTCYGCKATTFNGQLVEGSSKCFDLSKAENLQGLACTSIHVGVFALRTMHFDQNCTSTHSLRYIPKVKYRSAWLVEVQYRCEIKVSKCKVWKNEVSVEVNESTWNFRIEVKRSKWNFVSKWKDRNETLSRSEMIEADFLFDVNKSKWKKYRSE